MPHTTLDPTELLHLSLDAMRLGRDGEATAMLKSLVAREPDHAQGHYLLAAQYAQVGLMDRAEASFRTAADLAPTFAIARFQLGQLLLIQNRIEEARVAMSEMDDPALRAYADGLIAVAEGDIEAGIQHLETGLSLPQDNAPLADDMRRLSMTWRENLGQSLQESNQLISQGAGMLLSNYGRLS